MKKQKMILIVGGCVSLVLVVATTVMTLHRIQVASGIRQETDSALNRLKGFFTRNPFPSQENIEIERENQAQYAEQVEALTKALQKGAIVMTEQHSPGNFRRVCEETITALQREAPKTESGASIIENNFYFGFGRYDTSQTGGGVPAAQADVSRLMRQLKMVDQLVRIFYSANILKLNAVYREEFDTPSSDTESESESGRRGRRRKGGREASAFVLSMTPPSYEAAPIPVDCQRFGFSFEAREASLTAVMNAVNAAWPYLQVSGLQFVKSSADVVFPKVEEEKENSKGNLGDGIQVPPKGKTSRIVSGVLREAPLKVQMTIDVLTFNQAVEASEATSESAE